MQDFVYNKSHWVVHIVVVQLLYPTLCDLMDCSTPGFSVLHHLPGFAQTHIHWVGDAIQPSPSSIAPFSSCPQSFPASGSFPMSQLFTSGGHYTGASSSASVSPMNVQGWFPLGLLISLLSKGSKLPLSWGHFKTELILKKNLKRLVTYCYRTWTFI